jgi:Holliday junction DNA helicase RuvA
MYEYIKGEVAEKGLNYAVIEAGGVGYRIYTNAYTLMKLNETTAKLFSYLYVREDEHTLYGFFTQEEKNMFLRLLGISGIGPKVALAVLSAMTVNDVAVAIITSNTKAFSKVSGVGNKTAQRIILELKEKIESKEAVELMGGLNAEGGQDAAAEAVNALCALGYVRGEAFSAVTSVCKLADSTEEIILLALKRMDRG